MRILAVVFQILTLFMLTGSGAFLRRKQILTEPVIHGINASVLAVAWPALVIMSTQKQLSAGNLDGFFRILLYATLLMAGVSAVLMAACKGRTEENKRSVFVALCALPNTGFVGIPLVRAFYGDEGLAYLAGYIVAFNLVLWTQYVLIFGGKQANPFRAALNISVLAAVCAVLLLVFQVRIPEPFASFFDQLASLTTPLSMILLGARLKESLNIKQILDRTLLSAVGIRLLLFPLLAYGVMRAMGIHGMELGVMVMASAMPCASVGQMFAEKYHKDVGFAAQGISLSLILCVFTIPFILWMTGL